MATRQQLATGQRATKGRTGERGSSTQGNNRRMTITCGGEEIETSLYVPPGWPDGVHPPGAPEWESTAVAWLLDCCPADFRGYPVLRRHPVVLAGFAAQFVESQYRASQAGLAGVRDRLGDHVPPHVVESAAEAWQEQAAQLVRVRRAVALVEEALRGKVFIRRL